MAKDQRGLKGPSQRTYTKKEKKKSYNEYINKTNKHKTKTCQKPQNQP